MSAEAMLCLLWQALSLVFVCALQAYNSNLASVSAAFTGLGLGQDSREPSPNPSSSSPTIGRIFAYIERSVGSFTSVASGSLSPCLS